MTNVTWLNPWSMKVEAVGRSENEIILKFEQHVGGKDFGPWASEDMVYFREFSPSDDVGPGVCPADVALGSAQLFDYINRFKTGFFKHGAMPAVIIGASEYASDDDKRQMERFFNRMIVGGYRHVPIVDEQNRPVSVVSIKDVARFVLSHFREEVTNIQAEPYRGPPKVYGG